jgi:hypothetical protein
VQARKCGILALLAFGAMTWRAYGQDLASTAGDSRDRQVVARVAGREITLTDVDAYLGAEAFQLKLRLFEMRREAVKQMGDALLIRTAEETQHMTVQELLRTKIAAQQEPRSNEVDRQ